MFARRSWFALALVALCELFICVSVRSDSTSSAVRSGVNRTLNIPGVKDAGRVDGFLYRGAQPSEKGLRELRRLGVGTIIDLRGEWPLEIKKERRQAQSLGIYFVNLPGNGWSAPPDKQIAEFFRIIRERPRGRIFVHCWLGGDRSGVFIAAYRIAFDRWTPEEAIQEMHAYHFKAFWHPNMTAYVRGFPARLAHSPLLASYRHVGERESFEPARQGRLEISEVDCAASLKLRTIARNSSFAIR
jgi:hypothetical protein